MDGVAVVEEPVVTPAGEEAVAPEPEPKPDIVTLVVSPQDLIDELPPSSNISFSLALKKPQ